MEEDDIIIFNNVEPHGWKLIGGDMKLLGDDLFTGIRGRKAEYF